MRQFNRTLVLRYNKAIIDLTYALLCEDYFDSATLVGSESTVMTTVESSDEEDSSTTRSRGASAKRRERRKQAKARAKAEALASAVDDSDEERGAASVPVAVDGAGGGGAVVVAAAAAASGGGASYPEGLPTPDRKRRNKHRKEKVSTLVGGAVADSTYDPDEERGLAAAAVADKADGATMVTSVAENSGMTDHAPGAFGGAGGAAAAASGGAGGGLKKPSVAASGIRVHVINPGSKRLIVVNNQIRVDHRCVAFDHPEVRDKVLMYDSSDEGRGRRDVIPVGGAHTGGRVFAGVGAKVTEVLTEAQHKRLIDQIQSGTVVKKTERNLWVAEVDGDTRVAADKTRLVKGKHDGRDALAWFDRTGTHKGSGKSTLFGR